jgi:hypothetical protein
MLVLFGDAREQRYAYLPYGRWPIARGLTAAIPISMSEYV